MIDISVIVPVYNTSKYIKECIESILNQTYTNYEVLFVNDGSTDDSLAILETYSDPRFHIINQKNQGLAVARNNAVKLAKGEYITFVDSDDYIANTMFETLINASFNKKADIVWCDMVTFMKEEKNRLYKEFPAILDAKKSYILNNAGPCAKLIKKDVLVRNNLFFLTNHVYEDIAVVPAYALYADEIIYVDEGLYYYRLHEGSTMKQVTYNVKMEDIFDSMEVLHNYFKDSYKEEMEYIYIKHLLHAASLRFLPYEEGKKQRTRIVKIMKNLYPSWNKNVYFKQTDIKYKIICNLLYGEKDGMLSLLLK